MTPEWSASATDFPLGDGRFATAVDRPSSLDELRAAILARRDEHAAVYPQGGKTALDYGGTPSRPGVALDMTALSKVIDYPAADMTITIEAGITLAELQRILAEQNQRLPIDAPAADRATLGGIYATNFSGPRRFGWGRPRDQIIGVSFVTSAGEVVKGGGRVVKNVAGYDFPKLLTGSMGTLGVIVGMTLKVRPAPEASALAWCSGLAADAAATALENLNTSATRPVAIELLNQSAAQRVGGPLGLSANGLTLVIGFEGNAVEVPWQLDRIQDELKPAAVERVESNATAALWSALAEFADARLDGPISLVASVRPSGVVPFIASLNPLDWAVQAHAGNGIIRAHALRDPGQDVFTKEYGRLAAAAKDQSGSVILARCPTAWKAAVPVWGEPRGDRELMARIKAALDPHDLWNPGRFADSNSGP